ncbi:CG17239, partial [Drosophila busckii]
MSLLLLFLSAQYGIECAKFIKQNRIVGGAAANIEDFPWQVAIYTSNKYYCGGSIYSATVIITAAHCIETMYLDTLTVRAGSSYVDYGGVTRRVANGIYHRGFGEHNKYDIALLRLESRLPLGKGIQTIRLTKYTPAAGTRVTVSGWGLTHNKGSAAKRLLSVTMSIIDRSVCASSRYGYGSNIQDTMMCAVEPNKDACRGDSGGPLVANNELVGVVSWGFDCAHPRYPGVFADVAKLRDWI